MPRWQGSCQLKLDHLPAGRGCGICPIECLRLGVTDLEFEWQALIVYDGKEAQALATVRYRLRMDPSLLAGSTVHNVMHPRDESGLTLGRVALSRIGTSDLSSSAKAVSAGRAVAGAVLTYTISLANDGLAAAPAERPDP